MAQTTLREYLQSTEDAISSGRVADARANCQNILTHFPELLEAQRLLGEVYLAENQLEEAQQTFDWVLTNDPENVVAYCSRALISQRMADYDTALDCYQQAYELSRGNREIRQEFNQLSEKVGQQGFIFSRAGLARLYMRGDLLSQAIQEWETVLTTSPERLDARLGLLETCWREGLYDRVEQLATQILQDVPGCLKALVLLAHVTFIQNALQAQELIQRAKELDPDLLMAQELFSDFMVSQPKDPFLGLLRQPSAVIPDTADEDTQRTAIEPVEEVAAAFGTWTADSTAQPDSWTSTDLQDNLVKQELPAQSIQAGSERLEPDFDLWASWGQDADAIVQDQAKSELMPTPQDAKEDRDSDMTPDQESPEQEQPWYHMDVFEEPPVDSWSSANNIEPASINTWKAEEQEAELPAPPAWLDMLTKEERRQPGGRLPMQPSTTPPVEQEALTFVGKSPTQQNAESESGTPMAGNESDNRTVALPLEFPEDEEEPYFFGPEWLKTLGAAALESTLPPETETPAPSPEPEPAAPEQPMAPSLQAETTQKTPVESWLEQAAQRLTQPGEYSLTTLEELENDLRTQGFAPLEPGTLSTIAQEPTLSAALAQLGNIGPQPTHESNPVQPTTQPETTPIVPPVEPLWPPTTNAPAKEDSHLQPAVNESQEQTSEQSSHLDELARYISTPVPEPMSRNEPEPIHADALSSLVSNAVPVPTLSVSPVVEARPAVSLESELETTMKRPSVRLQPMQQRPASQQKQAMAKGRSGERSAAESGLSNKERLIKGYQYQLAGAYDDAMQEYRFIIRNAPELLSEVVSNMRALLKLAPKYSSGYRVLGDAYMRQGEYLQAMEAYNKALTMAKKARSQGDRELGK